MKIVNLLQDYLDNLDQKNLYRYLFIFLGILLALILLLFYLQASYVSSYKKQLQTINLQRKQAQDILTTYKTVQQQKDQVKEIIDKSKNFRIGQAYQSIIQELNLVNNQPELPVPEAGDEIGEQSEILLRVLLNGITMKELAELLQNIASKPQIYPTDLIIKRAANNRTIDIELTIAALEPKEG